MKTMAHAIGGVTVVELDGEIDMLDTDGLGASLDELVAQKPQRVVLDLSGVKYIASSGIGILIRFVQLMRRAGGKVRIANVTPAVQTVLDTVNMKAMVPFDATIEEAVEKLR